MSVREAWNMECPQCHEDDYLRIVASMWVTLHEDGTEEDACAHEWDDKSDCECSSCGWSGTVAEAQIKEPEEEDHDLSYLAKQAAKYDHEQNLDKED